MADKRKYNWYLEDLREGNDPQFPDRTRRRMRCESLDQETETDGGIRG